MSDAAGTEQPPESPPSASPSVVDPSSEARPSTVDLALTRYDSIVNQITSRFTGIGLITHHEIVALANAQRSGLASALAYIADPAGVDAAEKTAADEAAARQSAQEQPAEPAPEAPGSPVVTSDKLAADVEDVLA